VTRLTRAPALSIAVIAPLVFAGAVSGEARRLVLPPSASAAAPFTKAAVVSPARDLSGPAVVAAAREPLSRHVLTAATSAPPPPILVNAPTALGIPSMALAAYRNAEQKMSVSNPDCGIRWNLLAGIGRIESGHANGGATDAQGTAVRPIYGPTLPGTWARYAADGDGDGKADPQNLYDATLAAARYLCSGGLNLRDQSQVLSSILRYNNSMPYAQNVLGWAAAYATGVVPVDLPLVTGPAPPLGDVHLENPEGLGPNLPLNMHGLPSTDPPARMPLIDLGQLPMPGQQPLWLSPSTSEAPSCTLICIGD
jgi:membrane-bound lytic murein transglycosylase B